MSHCGRVNSKIIKTIETIDFEFLVEIYNGTVLKNLDNFREVDIWIRKRSSSLYFSYTTFTCQHVGISCTFLLDSLANDRKISFDISFDDAHSNHYG